MAQIPVVFNEYIGDGVTRIFNLTWDYLSRVEVFVSVNGVNVPFTWLAGSGSSVQLVTAPAPTTVVRLYRNTRAIVPLHKFAGGVPFLPRYVDENNEQLLFAFQEGLSDFNEIRDTADEALEGVALAQAAAVSAAADAASVAANMQRAVRVPSTDAVIPALPSAAARANKVLSFDVSGNPVVVAPASGSAAELAIDLANGVDPTKGSAMVGWHDPFAATYIKTVSDMKAGEPVNLFRIVPDTEHEAMQNGTSTYDCSADINEAYDLFHENTLKGGILEAPKGRFLINDGLTLRGGITLRGAGKDASTFVIGDSATVRLLGLGNTLERLCFHKDTPRGNYVTAGHMTDAAQTAMLSEVGYCKFTATQLAEFVNYALIGNYRSQGITVHNNRMFTYHLAFITKYLTSDWVRLHNNYAKALQSANVTNSELFKLEAINTGWVTDNHLISEGVPNALSCLTLESGTSNAHVRGNTMRADTGYAVRVEHSDNTITAPTDCTLADNKLIASGTALAVYSGNANVSGLELTGGTITGPVTIYGKKTRLNNIVVRAGFTDPRTGLTLRGDDIKGRNVEVVGFGVGMANAAVSGLPDTNFDIRGFKASGQANESVVLKYLAGKCFLAVESIDNSSAAQAAVSLLASGAVTPADTLTVEPGAITAPNMPGLKVNFMNGVTVGDCSKIRSPTRYSIITSDTAFTFESVFIAANMNSISHRVNTVGKYAGRVVYNTGPKKPYYATGPAPGDVWVDSAGTTTYTPV